MAAERVLAQHRLDLSGKAVDAAAQIGPARRQVNPDTVRQPDHERLATTSSSRSSAPASKLRPTRTTQPPGKASSIRASPGSGAAGSATWTARNLVPAADTGEAGASAARAFSREFQQPSVPALRPCCSLYSRSDSPLLFQPAT